MQKYTEFTSIYNAAVGVNFHTIHRLIKTGKEDQYQYSIT